MGAPGTETALVEVFSAREFFRSCAREAGSPSAGVVQRPVKLPSPAGLEETAGAGNGSLVWVDGLVRQYQGSASVLRAIRAGETPHPIVGHSRLASAPAVHFLDPESLFQHPRTAASILGCAGLIVATAETATGIHCPVCRHTAPRFRRPNQVCAQLLSSLPGQAATISVASESDALRDWADQSGFSTTREGSGLWRASIDSGAVEQGLILRLLPVLHSVWRIPGARFVVETPSSVLSLAPHGYCPSCDMLFSTAVRKRIEAIVRQGGEPNEGFSPEGNLDIAGMPLRELLTVALGDEPFPAALSPCLPNSLRTRLCALGLGHLQLGTLSSSLSSSELTALCAAATLTNETGIAVLDLPSGAASDTAMAGITEWLSLRASTAPTVMVGCVPRACQHSSWDELEHTHSGRELGSLRDQSGDRPICCGLTVLSRRSGTQGSRPWPTPDSIQLREYTLLKTLRVYDSFSLRRSTLIEALQLFEPLSKLLASSVDSRAFGLSAKDLALRPRGSRGFACRACGGLGVLLEPGEAISRPQAARCSVCDGSRFVGGPEKLMFKGLSIPQILNSSCGEQLSLLGALPRSSLALRLLDLLDLLHLPLGMPLALLSRSERRRVQLLEAALSGHSPKRPQVVLVELPFSGLAAKHAIGVRKLLTTGELAPHVGWVAIE